MPQLALGDSIPHDTAHAVSVSLPTWNSNVAWASGDQSVVSQMSTGYPRFFIHRSIEKFARDVATKFGDATHQAMLFPTKLTAAWCADFLRDKAPAHALEGLDIVHLGLDLSRPGGTAIESLSPSVSAVLFHRDAYKCARQFWQHSGVGISSRRTEFCHSLLNQGILVPEDSSRTIAPSERLQINITQHISQSGYQGTTSFPEENGENALGRNHIPTKALHQSSSIPSAEGEKAILRRRIAGILDRSRASPPKRSLETGLPGQSTERLAEHDVYLFPTGMSAIFNVHRFLLAVRGSMKSVSFGFPYVDTLKILQKFGPGCVFYGNASEENLDQLQARLEDGERFLGLFCEFPGNPLLTCPNLKRIRSLADQYDFAVVVDDTIGTFGNVDVLQYVDVVVTSLTKFFSGACNVTGGSAAFNPKYRYYSQLKATAEKEYVDLYWPEDAVVMERNSRDFLTRIVRMNHNAEAVAELLRDHPLIRRVCYPKYNLDRANYEDCRLPNGGYGGLLSVTFHRDEDAIVFYDHLETHKGPSLGTNFTLTSPYVILAHMAELEWAASLGVDPSLVRFSVGIEDVEELIRVFKDALAKIPIICGLTLYTELQGWVPSIIRAYNNNHIRPDRHNERYVIEFEEGEPRYVGEPRPEIDEAWEDLLSRRRKSIVSTRGHTNADNPGSHQLQPLGRVC
ncbi:cystathionine gamma-synthase [Colletotrichum sojae]|uniref:cystathionine gamma-synthase n=1 Tax=Colletotrichum sojae TaxID=2175907 RepID=A0A8H6J1N9_9PEZI|nr:cystathionine gamma-synthase [Colletotrichum sojae]